MHAVSYCCHYITYFIVSLASIIIITIIDARIHVHGEADLDQGIYYSIVLTLP